MKTPVDRRATSALAGAVICWSVVPLFLKAFTPYVDAWTANGIRYPFAALLYLPILIRFSRLNRLPLRTWRLALVPVLFNISSQILWAWAPYYIDPGLMAFTVRLSTLWAVTGSFMLFSDERRLLRSSRFWTGFAMALGGFLFLTLGGQDRLEGATLTGIVLIFFTSIGWAGYQVSVRRNMRDIDSRVAFGMISSITSMGLISAMMIWGEPERALHMPAEMGVLVLLSGIIGIAAAHMLFYVAIKRVGVAIGASANLISPFLTALLSRFLYHEQLTPVQWLAGIGLVAGGIMLTLAQVHLRRR